MAEDTHGRARLSPAVVETIAGVTAGSAATLVVHPLDIVKTRMQIHRSQATPGSAPLSTLAVVRSLTRSPKPLQAMYRGLSVNIAGNAASWGGFFYFKTHIERAIVYTKGADPTPPSSTSNQRRPSAVDERRKRLTPFDFFLSSLLAGAATALMTNPLWVLKTRLLSSDQTAKGAYPGPVRGTIQLWKDEGWRGGYRGLAISMIGVAHGAVHFAVYEPAKKMYLSWRDLRRESTGPEELSRLNNKGKRDGGDKISDGATLVLSSTAKLVANAVTYPYQVIRSRLQNYNAEERFGRGIRGVAVRVWREEGPIGFYRGMVPGVIRVLPATWITFLVYENMKHELPNWVGEI
ncbi:mitochondrial folate carrier protein [Zalerion maritima]|uniref:Mitochondrial folate carrier protein n=1 Tax=Zalerion maritima TaxID=339359 RepID=A0AAD5RS19_9PEZI|nr:mitochondrial folate carrier protein [Zalerion maritima]